MRVKTLLPIALMSSVVSLSAENWPSWRGPSRNGISSEKNLPIKWSHTGGDNIMWKLPMPAMSGSTPIVWGDRIFLNVADACRTPARSRASICGASIASRAPSCGSAISAAAIACSGNRTNRRRRR